MNAMKTRDCDYPIAVDINKLAAMLNVGLATARSIGEKSNAKVKIGRRCVYKVDKIKTYLDSISDN